MLLVDDIQDMDDKGAIRAEFLRTFAALYNGRKQLVISCDRAPGRLVTIEDRLRTWFGQGLLAEIVIMADGER
jgi:chromosomal replication initiator protein